MHTSRAFFSKIIALFLQNQGNVFLFSKKGQRRPWPFPPLVARLYWGPPPKKKVGVPPFGVPPRW